MNAERIEIDTALVRSLVASQFPQWSELSIRPVEPGGWDNRTFFLGDTMSIRLPSAESYADQVAKEHQWLPKLAPHLPLPIPMPLAKGVPADSYPWHWSVYKWIGGETATRDRIKDLSEFARALASFLKALHRIDIEDGPAPGAHNFFRGGSLSVYDEETRQAISVLDGKIDSDLALHVWEMALSSTWNSAPVWVHGDVSAGNILVKNGTLSAVIDFGCCAVGDPACDLAIAWTLFEGESRRVFRESLSLDEETWARARGWTLWKALITACKLPEEKLLDCALIQLIKSVMYEEPICE
ncbi:MAG: aminoglycoside phosphotransferase [Cyanobacteria bacterium PR.3.49]|nr:aminoglycoside phosphotransferase [Cyanobacteria bacterium PR.3.49]